MKFEVSRTLCLWAAEWSPKVGFPMGFPMESGMGFWMEFLSSLHRKSPLPMRILTGLGLGGGVS